MTDLVVWRKPPPLISKGLYRKATKLSLKEALWVWDDVIATGVSVGLAVLSILWLTLPYTMQGWAIVLLAVAMILFVASIVPLIERLLGEDDPLKFNYGTSKKLSHRGRKQLCLLDRNRKRAPGWERSWRMPNIEHNQYSVWVTSETDQYRPHAMGLMFRIIEHRPQQYGIGPRWAMICRQTRYVKVSHTEDGSREVDESGKRRSPEVEEQMYALNAERFETDINFDKAIDIQRDLEEIADYLEGHGYNKKVKVHEMERIALQLRR